MNWINNYNIFPELHPVLVVLIVAWIVVWKGLALWKSARKRQEIWFIALLVINTLGILEILYVFIFSEMNRKEKRIKAKKKR